jgi:hypothetical protein
MNIVLFQEITTDEALQKLEDEGKKYEGLYVDMDDKKERKYVKDNAALISNMLKKLDRARIDKARDHKTSIEAEAADIKGRLELANLPFSKLIDEHKEKRAAILAEEKAKAEAEELLLQIGYDHDQALMMDKIRTIEAAEQEQERLANEKRIADEAAEHARIEAEKNAQAELDRIEQDRQGAIRREQEAKAQAQQAELDRIAAEERAAGQEQARINAEARAKEDAKAEAERAEVRRKESEEQARQQEIQRQKDEQARIQQEQEKREANKRHVGAVRKAAKESLMATGLDEAAAKRVVMAIHNGSIASVEIKY